MPFSMIFDLLLNADLAYQTRALRTKRGPPRFRKIKTQYAVDRYWSFGVPSNPESFSERSSMPRLSGVSSSHFLKLIEEKANVGFWTSEFSTNRLTISEGVKRLMAVQISQDASYEDLVRMMHPDDRPAHENMRELVRAGQPVSREFRIIRADGTLRWIRNIADVVADKNGTPIRAVGLCMDVTDRHEASRSVIEGWKSYKTLVSAIAPLQWRNLPSGTVTHREGWDGIVGDCFDGSSKWLEKVHPDDRETARQVWAECLASGRVLRSALRLQGMDGEYRQYISRAAPILDDAGAIQEWLGVLISVDDHRLPGLREPENTHEMSYELRLEGCKIKAARALLQWTTEDLAQRAGVSVSTVRRIEVDDDHSVRAKLHQAIRNAFKSAGVCFENGPGSQSSIVFNKIEVGTI